MLKLFLPGNRTYTLSVAALILALLVQGDSQGFIELAPILKMACTMLLTIIVPMVPIFIRKALPTNKQ